MDHIDEEELLRQAVILKTEVQTLEKDKARLIALIHEKRLQLNRICELLEIKGVTF